MLRLPTLALMSALLVLSGGLNGQEAKKDDPKTTKKDEKKEDPKTAKKDDPPAKVKGTLPRDWGKIGLGDDQKQDIYKIQSKYNSDIDRLEAKIKELKGARDKEMRGVLSADQKKRLEEIVIGKDKDK
ncbi:MAG: hypothetical protein JWO38_839 [Gemmataceae bacterium]|nr:hypothetical protein [Gemmataceae bacterium]